MTEKPGEPIKGSRFVRAYCKGCKEPMRLTETDFENHKKHWCSLCDPSMAGGGGKMVGGYDPGLVQDLKYHGEGLSGEHSIG